MINLRGVLVGILISQLALAEPEVIADFGGKATGLVSPTERLRAIASNQSSSGVIARKPVVDRFPLLSDMRVGIIEAHAHNKPVSRAFFIIGFDQQSAEWLEANRNYLLELNARGLVTNVKSEQELEKLREYGGELPLDAIPVDSIAAVFDLEFYPVLITKEEVTQ